MKYTEEHIKNYALSLIKHNLYDDIDSAMAESKRWHKKAENGLVEPLLCPHRPDVEVEVKHNDNGSTTVTYKF